jgi:hypothetical protein
VVLAPPTGQSKKERILVPRPCPFIPLMTTEWVGLSLISEYTGWLVSYQVTDKAPKILWAWVRVLTYLNQQTRNIYTYPHAQENILD